MQILHVQRLIGSKANYNRKIENIPLGCVLFRCEASLLVTLLVFVCCVVSVVKVIFFKYRALINIIIKINHI